jgi:TldD protein
MEIQDDLKCIDDDLIRKLNQLASNNVEYWDIRCGFKTGTTLEFTEQISKQITSYETVDCGIRTFINGGWGFFVLNELSNDSLLNGFSKGIKLAKVSEKYAKEKFKLIETDPLIKTFQIRGKKKREDINEEEKVDYIKSKDKDALSFSEKIKNTLTYYVDGHSQNIFINSIGSNIYQDITMLRTFFVVFAQKNGVLQRSTNSIGGLGGFEILNTEHAENLSVKSAKEAVELLDAKSPVGGNFTIIMDPKLTGTFVHEAFGHAVEADFVLSKESILEGKIGEKVAQDNINILDDPTMGQGKKYNLPYELFGSYFIDDEGIPSQRTNIIENGVLKEYLHTLETSSRLELPINGHGRASSNISRPQVRMGITLLEPGDWTLDDMINDTKNGILCEDFQYGYTDPTTGNFQFKCKFSYKIVNGEKKELMRDVSLSGMTLEVLNRVSAIGKDIHYSDGMCGKGGQGVRVCDGGPYIRVDNVSVGGLS